MILISDQMIRLAQSIDTPIGVSEFRPEGPLVIIISATRTDLTIGYLDSVLGTTQRNRTHRVFPQRM